ncbi:hypothetical protein WLH_05954 [Escherichia coli O25b:H4]|uniref:Uncharacterized protein n=1 Tax=Escherichia coli O25b:H4 TaxID=941280 RepID=A0A192CJ69_ECO25|nr:hypothetical protein WLH_04967 [Escherichia coli O25b:H4]ANK07215.1 hypothetical protein WLH_05954 [Escherichia coli O25b:H4]
MFALKIKQEHFEKVNRCIYLLLMNESNSNLDN